MAEIYVKHCKHGVAFNLCHVCNNMTDYERGKADGIKEERERSAELWKLLDDIDTASDAFKTNYEGLAKYVYHTQRKRFAIMTGEEYDAIRSAKEIK